VSKPLALRFVTSADRLDRLPPSPAEVTVVGRSNVGKSSLLNALANRKDLAKTSKTPGRTQLLNLFELEPHDAVAGTLVDCPGYGYAKTSRSIRAGFQPMIEGYLTGREELRMIGVLVDGEIGPTKLDVQLLEWLRHHGLPYAVIATKHDKVKAKGRERRKRDLADGCGVDRGDVLWVSAHSGVNIDVLRDRVREWLAPT
jgi:GTP-binding protein